MITIAELLYFLLRDLDKFISEIEAFHPEAGLWRVEGEVTNCAGNLSLHIAGNLQHFIGATLGATGYMRDRDREFSEKNVPKSELLRQLHEARAVVEQVLGQMSSNQLSAVYPADYFGEGRSIAFVMLTLLAHLNYHLGQVNYLRRLLA